MDQWGLLAKIHTKQSLVVDTLAAQQSRVDFLIPKYGKEIELAIHEIEAQTIENVLKNWVDRMGYCKASRGSYLNDVVFHS